MIVWDSREAEERNARQSLAERTRDIQRARRRVHRYTAELVLLPLAVVGCIVLAAYWQTPLTTVAAAALSSLIWVEASARRRAARRVPVYEARLRVARENHDRVFGGQQ